MEANLPYTVLLQNKWKMLRDVSWFHKFANLVDMMLYFIGTTYCTLPHGKAADVWQDFE